jgi:hypothetical protein
MDHPKPWLRYVAVDDVDDQTLDLKSMKVRNAAGEELGSLDGLIVDSTSGRTYYVVINAGHWFSSKYVLMPIGVLSLDKSRNAIAVDLSNERLKRVPGFDKDQFPSLTEQDIRRMNDEVAAVFEPDRTYAANEPYTAAWDRPSYRTPDWWTVTLSSDASVYSSPGDYRMRGTDADRQTTSTTSEATRASRGRSGDESPHFDGRAQPGDVIGVETGGEQTYLGDTKEDEDKRREDAEKSSHRSM